MVKHITGSIPNNHLVRKTKPFVLESVDSGILRKLKEPLKPSSVASNCCPLTSWYKDLSKTEQTLVRKHIKHLASEPETSSKHQAFDIVGRLMDHNIGVTKDVLKHVAKEVLNHVWCLTSMQRDAEKILMTLNDPANNSFYGPRG